MTRQVCTAFFCVANLTVSTTAFCEKIFEKVRADKSSLYVEKELYLGGPRVGSQEVVYSYTLYLLNGSGKPVKLWETGRVLPVGIEVTPTIEIYDVELIDDAAIVVYRSGVGIVANVITDGPKGRVEQVSYQDSELRRLSNVSPVKVSGAKIGGSLLKGDLFVTLTVNDAEVRYVYSAETRKWLSQLDLLRQRQLAASQPATRPATSPTKAK